MHAFLISPLSVSPPLLLQGKNSAGNKYITYAQAARLRGTPRGHNGCQWPAVGPTAAVATAKSDESKSKHVDHVKSTEALVVDAEVTAAPAPVAQTADEDASCVAPPAPAAETTDKVTVLNNSSNTEVPGESKAPDSSSDETPVQGNKTVVTTPEPIPAKRLVGDTDVAAPRGIVVQIADVPKSKVCKLGHGHDARPTPTDTYRYTHTPAPYLPVPEPVPAHAHTHAPTPTHTHTPTHRPTWQWRSN